MKSLVLLIFGLIRLIGWHKKSCHAKENRVVTAQSHKSEENYFFLRFSKPIAPNPSRVTVAGSGIYALLLTTILRLFVR